MWTQHKLIAPYGYSDHPELEVLDFSLIASAHLPVFMQPLAGSQQEHGSSVVQ
jgi:hypothetical protein